MSEAKVTKESIRTEPDLSRFMDACASNENARENWLGACEGIYVVIKKAIPESLNADLHSWQAALQLYQAGYRLVK